MVPFEPWTVTEILDFLAEYEAKIILRDGAPLLDIPRFPADKWGRDVSPEWVKRQIWPHLKARREELLTYLIEQSDPSIRAKRIAKEKREAKARELEARKAIVAATIARAQAAQKPCWFMARPELRPTRCGTDEPPDDAAYFCVEGDERWTVLPAPVDPAVMAARKKEGGKAAKRKTKEVNRSASPELPYLRP